MRRRTWRKSPAPITHLLGADNIDTQDYHGRIGDVIRIESYTPFGLDRVIVTIRADSMNLVEHGQAKFHPETNRWEYTATAENRTDEWSIVATAVRQIRT